MKTFNNFFLTFVMATSMALVVAQTPAIAEDAATDSQATTMAQDNAQDTQDQAVTQEDQQVTTQPVEQPTDQGMTEEAKSPTGDEQAAEPWYRKWLKKFGLCK